MPPVILLMGPTASGKSALAMEIASRLPVEIVSVDSAQVYRGMDIGTAKPGAADRAAVPHHLIDIIDPVQAYSAARFRSDASALIDAIEGRGRIPLLVGGTMLYFKALLEGLSDMPPSDPRLRSEIDAEAAARGWPAMHAELAKIDPAAAARLEPKDSQRIQRALEVYRTSGRTLSDLIASGTKNGMRFRPIRITLLPSDRAALHRRIEMRFEAMLESGLIDELRSLRQRYPLVPGLPSMRCVGYRQVWQFLQEEFDQTELRERGIYATRQFAKRQLTWLRSMPKANVFDCLDAALNSRVLELVAREIDRR